MDPMEEMSARQRLLTEQAAGVLGMAERATPDSPWDRLVRAERLIERAQDAIMPTRAGNVVTARAHATAAAAHLVAFLADTA